MRNPLGLGALSSFRRRFAAVRSFLLRIMSVNPESILIPNKQSPPRVLGRGWESLIRQGYRLGRWMSTASGVPMYETA